jgi:hypothetical protein
MTLCLNLWQYLFYYEIRQDSAHRFMYASVLCFVLVCYSMWYVCFCVLCLAVVPLPPGKSPFAVQSNNNNNVWKDLIRIGWGGTDWIKDLLCARRLTFGSQKIVGKVLIGGDWWALSKSLLPSSYCLLSKVYLHSILQVGRSRVRDSVRSSKFFSVCLILLAVLDPWDHLASNRNKYQKHTNNVSGE